MDGKMRVLLTGGTGFLGEYLLAELLRRGHTVWALYRSEPKKLDTIRFLSSMGLPHSSDSLNWFKGEILEAGDQWDTWLQEYPGLEETDTLLHSAASTRLHMDESGEPLKTNVGSAKVYAPLYKEFKNSIVLPESYVDRMYTSKYMRHFYSEEEIARFREKWHISGN